jgi:hypothetical protein
VQIVLTRKDIIIISSNRNDTNPVWIITIDMDSQRTNDQDDLFLNWPEESCYATTGTMGQRLRKTRHQNDVRLRLVQKADQKTEEASRKAQVGRAEV